MSGIAKIWNLCNFRAVLSYITSKIHNKVYSPDTTVQRFYSKRFTYCNNCRKCPPKPKKCDKKLTKPSKKSKKSSKSAKPDKCTPCPKKPSKKSKPLKKPKKCKPGMRNPCDEIVCQPDCTLIKGKRKYSCNECVEERSSTSKGCPKGDWQRD